MQVTEEEATEQYQKLMAGDKKAKGDGGHSDQGAPLTRAAGGSAVGTANVTHKDNENIVVLSFLRDLLKCAALFPLFLASICPTVGSICPRFIFLCLPSFLRDLLKRAAFLIPACLGFRLP